jgi:hypothetical protein
MASNVEWVFIPAVHRRSMLLRAKHFGSNLGPNQSPSLPCRHLPHLGGKALWLTACWFGCVRLIRVISLSGTPPFRICIGLWLLPCRAGSGLYDVKIPRFGSCRDCITRLASLPLFISPYPSPNLVQYHIMKGNSDGTMGSNGNIQHHRNGQGSFGVFLEDFGERDFLPKENALDIISKDGLGGSLCPTGLSLFPSLCITN